MRRQPCWLAIARLEMSTFTAKLIGETDAHTVSRLFDTLASAQAWVTREGLVDFADQTARGEIFSAQGLLVWTRSLLQTTEQAEREQRLDAHRLLAGFGLQPKI
jgi:hypothetical protein